MIQFKLLLFRDASGMWSPDEEVSHLSLKLPVVLDWVTGGGWFNHSLGGYFVSGSQNSITSNHGLDLTTVPKPPMDRFISKEMLKLNLLHSTLTFTVLCSLCSKLSLPVQLTRDCYQKNSVSSHVKSTLHCQKTTIWDEKRPWNLFRVLGDKYGGLYEESFLV